MSQTIKDDKWRCTPCDREFPTWESLVKHKAYKLKTGAKDHIHCYVCGQDFKTEVAQLRHVQQTHPHEQVLDCPGCGRGPFHRLAGLMGHIEQGDCPRISISSLDEAREKKVEFTRRLAALAQEPNKNDYTRFLPLEQTAESSKNARSVTQDPGFTMIQSEFPALSLSGGKDHNATKSTAHSGDCDKPGGPAAWMEKENLFPHAADARRPSSQQLEAATRPSERTLFESMDPDDPGNPYFDAEKYYSSIIEQYICPKLGCGKVFKTSGRLVGHLRSPAHGDKTYRCPYCLKMFKTLTAITSHAESSSMNCRIRETDGYNAFLDQLTAGMVDVGGQNEDGTLQYTAAKSARAFSRS